MHDAVIIDDDEDIRTTVAMALETYQFTVREFPDGPPALTYLAEHPTPHLVITDYVMPQMNGEDLLRQALEQLHLRENCYILFAARPLRLLPSSVEAFLATWHIPFLAKPFDLDTFDALIQPCAD